MKFILVVSYLLVSPLSAGIPPYFDTVDKKAVYESFMNYIYDFSFDDADSVLLELDINEVDITLIQRMKSMYSWWAILSEYKVKENIGICKNQTDEAIGYLSKLENPGIDQQLDLIEAYILKVRLENYTDNKISTIPLLYKALNQIKKLIDNEELNDRKLLVMGLYYYFVDYIDKKYFLAGPVLKRYPKGSRDRGLGYLRKCLKSKDHLVKVEANYFLFKIYFSVEEDYNTAYDNILFLHNLYPNNIVFSYEMHKTMRKINSPESELFKQKILKQIEGSASLVSSQKAHFINLLNDYKD